ncbi:energy transducer TonB [Polyangium sp. y55x31]|uniref:energy transducer TonB n=1 Tax=Polyangium sp. y55x31 TaxID=3042688 RepID=UPI0024827D88|nr:energy transducer TonB [Polyangium sp. y55x31]MDI1477159.1 energy transducer TonB [Polyangium sp. y55x31]
MDHGRLSAGWLVAATAAHAALLGAGSLRDETGAVMRAMREAIRAELVVPFEVPIEAPRPPPPEPPPPEPPEEPPPPPQPVANHAPRPPQNDPPEAPPTEAPPTEAPTPMEAPPVLTQEEGPPDPSAVTFVTGDGYGTGLVSALGAGFRPVRHTGLGGGPPPRRPPAPPPDLSRPASLYGDRAWDCDFPPEAEAAGIRNALVVLQIVVRADGRAQKVDVVSDPGHGFGAQARYCAARHHYRPALDRAGQPTQASLGPVRIRFVR